MARHTGTCQHVTHAKDRERRESRNSKGPVNTGANRAPGFIEMENTKATPEQNASVKACIRCTVPQRARMSADEAKHWPKQGPSQMQEAFTLAFRAYGQRNGYQTTTAARKQWMTSADYRTRHQRQAA